MSKTGIVNIRMVITEEKILSNIDKVQKLINPNSKKQIVQLDEDTYFKDLIESIKAYLIEYPKKKNFPKAVYKAAYGLVEYATNQFEENTKQIEELIRQREKNIILSGKLKDILALVESKDKDWKAIIKEASIDFGEDITDTLGVIGRSKTPTSSNYKDAVKLINARIANLESNLHIEIDMERIEDRSKALSYIGIEVADALKVIPTPLDTEMEEISTNSEVKEETANVEVAVEEKKVVPVQQPLQTVQIATPQTDEQAQFIEDTRMEVKPSLWQRIKSSKIGRAFSYIFKINQLGTNALPEGKTE